MNTFYTGVKIFAVSFLMALTTYAQEQHDGHRIIGCLKHQKDSITVSACSDALAPFPDRPPRQ